MRRVLLHLIALGCRPGDHAITLAMDVDAVDECGQICGSVDGPPGRYAIVSDQDGEIAQVERGEGRFCVPEPLSVATHVLQAVSEDGAVSGGVSLDVKGFGWDYGIDRAEQVLTEVPWVPEVTGMSDMPVLAGTPDGWDADSVMAPALIRFGGQQILYYAGTAEEHFALGIATRATDDDRFQKIAGNPILRPGEPGQTPGSWKNWSQNTPEPLVVGDELWLYYNGQGESDGKLSIGLATSSDGLSFTDHEVNPVLAGTGTGTDWDGIGVAHPSVLIRDGVYEMWYASGSVFAVGYAISHDGVEWERYCNNPVFAGISEDSWDRAHIKSPEVVWDGQTYFMSWSGCDKACYQVGWAASSDGLRWIAWPDPILPAQESGWNRLATREGYVDVEGERWRFVYTGNDGLHERIGIATAIR